MSRNLLLFFQSKDFLDGNPFVKHLVTLAKEKQITLFSPESLGDTPVTPISFPRVTAPIPETTTPTWRDTCRPIVDAIDAQEDIDAIFVFDEYALRILTATRVPQKPIIWIGDLTPLATPKMTRYTSCALRLTHALFLPETLPGEQVQTICRWGKYNRQTIPEIKLCPETLSANAFLEQTTEVLSKRNPCLPAIIELGLRTNTLPHIGSGSRRACHQISDTGLCIKRYHLPETLTPKNHSYHTILKEITHYAHSHKENTSCQEYYYLQKIIKTKPDSIVAVFPEILENIYLPTYGWGLIETMVVNEDGSPALLFLNYLRKCKDNPEQYEKTLRLLTEFIEEIATNNLDFYDLKNILIQDLGNEKIHFRIADFEPRSRQLISFFLKLPLFIRWKIWRRFHRILERNNIAPVK